MAEILASTAGNVVATSSTFVATGLTSIQVVGLGVGDFVVLEYQYEAGSWYPVTAVGKEGRITGEVIPKLLAAPGTYRIQKPVTSNAVSIAYAE